MKLSDYCLNPVHPRGRHKARVFRSLLGIDQSNFEVLVDALLEHASLDDAEPGEKDQYGQRYTIRFDLQTTAGRGTIDSQCLDDQSG